MLWEGMQMYEKHSHFFISTSVISRVSGATGWEVVFECLPGPGVLDGLSWCFMLMQMRETPLKPMMFHQNNVRGGNETTSRRYIVAQMSEISQHPMGLNWGVWLKRRSVDKCHPSHWQKCIWQCGSKSLLCILVHCTRCARFYCVETFKRLC